MNTNCTRLDRPQKIMTKNFCAHRADDREKNLHRAIVMGAVLISLLVALAYYVRYADPGQPADGYSTSTLQPITRY